MPSSEEGSEEGEEALGSAELDHQRAETLRRVVSAKSERRIRSRERPNESIWAFMGTFGLVGWTVAVPTLAGLALGVFLDNRTDSERSFAITFLILGVAVGGATAWYWIRRESSGDRR